MHHALQVQEILLDIFGSCYDDDEHQPAYSDLASLARTCRTFKGPALDVLWEDLPNVSPLARCLPEASERLSKDKYSFRRPLTETEWCTLRNYTRRIRWIYELTEGLDEKSLILLYGPPTTEPLFPKLCSICFAPGQVLPLNMFCLPFPSLTSINAMLVNPPDWFRDPLESLSKSSPNITTLKLFGAHDAAFDKCISRCICRWKNIRHLICLDIALDANALSHLSHILTLTEVHCALSPTSVAFDSPLIFSNLTRVELRSESLQFISQLLFHTKLPTLMNFIATVRSSTSKARLSTFLHSFWSSTKCNAIRSLELSVPDRVDDLLTLEDLGPCLAFSNLQTIKLDIGWNVGLKDSDVLALASAWPHLTHFSINQHFGWNGIGGITPHGLWAFLQTCRSLKWVILAMDTRGYVEVPQRGLLESLAFPRTIYLYVLDTIIDAESVPALARFLAHMPQFRVSFIIAWAGDKMVRPPGWEVYRERWGDVHFQARRYSRDPH